MRRWLIEASFGLQPPFWWQLCAVQACSACCMKGSRRGPCTHAWQDSVHGVCACACMRRMSMGAASATGQTPWWTCTFFGIAGMSLMGQCGLEPTGPNYVLPAATVQHLRPPSEKEHGMPQQREAEKSQVWLLWAYTMCPWVLGGVQSCCWDPCVANINNTGAHHHQTADSLTPRKPIANVIGCMPGEMHACSGRKQVACMPLSTASQGLLQPN